MRFGNCYGDGRYADIRKRVVNGLGENISVQTAVVAGVLMQPSWHQMGNRGE